jgi:hypothetical protein
MTEIPEDFPRDPFPTSLAGSPPKLAARLIGGKYITALTDEERAERYKASGGRPYRGGGRTLHPAGRPPSSQAIIVRYSFDSSEHFNYTRWRGPAAALPATKALRILLCAKVSTAYSQQSFDSHVICVYTEDWQDTEDLLAVRQSLREAGFVEELGYKRDIDTARRIYGPEEWFKWA